MSSSLFSSHALRSTACAAARPGAAKSRISGAAPFVRKPVAGASGPQTTDRGRLQPRIQNDISEVLEIGTLALRPGSAMSLDFGGTPMVFSRAAVGQGIALQTPHDFAAGNGIGTFLGRDDAEQPTLALDGEDISFDNPKLRTAYGTVQALLHDLKARKWSPVTFF